MSPRIEDILRKHRDKHLEFVAAVCTRVVEDMPRASLRSKLAEVMKRSAGSINPADAIAALNGASGCEVCGRYCDGMNRCDICL